MTVAALAKKYKWNMPTVCPSCGADLQVDDSSGRVYCPEVSCPQKVEHKIMKMSNEWGVLGLGPAIIESLVTQVKIKSLSEFFDNVFGKKDLDAICGKNADKIRKNLTNILATPMTTAKFLAAFDLEGFGEKKIQTAVDAGWRITNPDIRLGSVFGWTNESAFDFNSKVQYDIVDIKSLLVRVKIQDNQESGGGKLDGLSFCFTGAMELKRSDLEKMVIDNGGKVAGVSKTLSFLVCQDLDTSSGKGEKARKLGVKMITPDEFLKMVE